MRKVAIAVAVLLVMLAAVVVVGPRLIDWNRYKPEIATRLETALGRRIDIDGDLSLSLFPVPAFSADRVRLANLPGASPPDMATVESLRLRLSPAALLRGAVRVESLVLVKPLVRLQELDDGRVNWRFGEAPDAAAGAPPAAPESPAAVPVRFDRLIVESGRVTYQRPGADPVGVEDIDATISAGSLEGPFEVEGEAVWRGLDVAYDLSTGRLFGNGPAPFSAALRLPRENAEVKVAGQIVTAKQVQVRGRLTATAADLGAVAVLATDPGALPPSLRQAFAFEGGVEASKERLAVNDIAIRLGATQASGAVAAQLTGRPKVDLSLVFGRLDLDALGAGDTAAAAPRDEPPAGAAPAAEGIVAGLADLALPEGFDASVNISADVVVYRAAIMRQAKLDASLVEGRLAVRRATALLPGGSDVSLSGTLRQADARLAVDGSVEAASDNLRAVLDWLGVAVGQVPADRLRKFAANAGLKGSLRELHLTDLDLRLDTSRLRGAATIRLEGRPAVGANLVVDNLNVDAYLPGAAEADAAQAPAAATTGGGAPGDGGLRFLAGFDANVRARADSLTTNDVTARNVLFDGSLVNGDLTVRQASVGDLGGASSQVRGTVANLAGGPIELRDLVYDLRTGQPAKVMRLFGLAPDLDLNRLAPVAVKGSVAGPLSEMRLAARAEIAGGEVEVKGVVGAEPRFDLDVAAMHPDAIALVRIFDAEYRPAGKLGGARLAANLKGEGLRVDASGLRLAIGSAEVTGAGSLDLAGKPSLSAKLEAGELVVDDFLPVSRAALLPRPPSDWLVAPATPQPVQFRLGAPSPPGAVHPAATPAGGDAPWSREPFDLAWLDGFDADVELAAKALSFRKYRLEAVEAAAQVTAGAATLQSLEASLFGGPLVADARLARDGAVAGKVAIDNAKLRQALATAAGIDVASGTLSARAAFTSGGNSPYAMVAGLSGDGELTVRDGVVQGLDLGAISRRLNNIENVGSLLGLLQAGVSGGQTPFSSLEASFTAKRGMISSQDITLQAEAGQGQGTATVDLPAYALQARMLFTLAAHPGMPLFGVRLEGPLDNPRRFFDVNELQAWLVSRGMGRLLKDRGGEAGKIIQDFLGGRPASPQPAPAEPQPQESVRPEDVLKGLLDQLGR